MPSCSADGTFFSFITNRLGKGGLYLISENRDDAAQSRFLQDVYGSCPWSPDGTRIAYGEDGVSIVDLKTGTVNYLIHTHSHPLGGYFLVRLSGERGGFTAIPSGRLASTRGQFITN